MSSVYDGNLTVSIFGQSHAPAIGVTIDGLPAGLPVDLDALGRFLRRRAPGQNAWSTPRKEADLPEFLCGLKDGRTCGAPLTAIIRNTNTRSGDYENLMDIPRPGHADYTAQVKFGGAQDAAGGGHFSGRLTAPLCIAGGLCLQILARQGVRVRARIVSIGTVTDDAAFDAPVDEKPFPAVSDEAAAAMQAQIAQAKAEQDSVGGVIECVIEGLPAARITTRSAWKTERSSQKRTTAAGSWAGSRTGCRSCSGRRSSRRRPFPGSRTRSACRGWRRRSSSSTGGTTPASSRARSRAWRQRRPSPCSTR